jgi:hypothetical protein
MLLRELLTEADLGEYSAVIIDEAHERSVATDILMVRNLRYEVVLLVQSMSQVLLFILRETCLGKQSTFFPLLYGLS